MLASGNSGIKTLEDLVSDIYQLADSKHHLLTCPVEVTTVIPSCPDSITCLLRSYSALYPPHNGHICFGNTFGIIFDLRCGPDVATKISVSTN